MTTDFIEFETNKCVSDDKETINKSIQKKKKNKRNNKNSKDQLGLRWF